MGLIFFFLLMVGMMMASTYFMENGRKKKQIKLVNSLNKGDKVILLSGLIGEIDELNTENNEVIIKSEGTNLRFSVNAISRVISQSEVEDVQISEKSAEEEYDDKTSQNIDESNKE